MTSQVPHVLAVIPSVIPSTTMVAIKPLTELSVQGKIQSRVVIESMANTGDLDWADVVVFSRNCEGQFVFLLDHLIKTSKPYIYDLDDNFFALPKGTTFADHYYKNGLGAVVEKYITYASRIRVYSSRLRETILPINKKVDLITPPLDWSLISSPQQKRGDDRVKIVYSTSRNQDELSHVFLPALRRILEENTQVRVYFLGYMPEEFRNVHHVHYWPFMRGYESFMRKFSSAGFDIGLAPLVEDEFHASKTNTKYRDYAASKIAGVYSDVSLYRSCVVSGVNGLIVQNTTHAWYQAIRSLVTDPALRLQIQELAYKDVQQHYTEADFLSVWYDIIMDVYNEAHGTQLIDLSPKHDPSEYRKLEEVVTPTSGGNRFVQKIGWVLRKMVNLSSSILHSPVSDWGIRSRALYERLTMLLYLYQVNRRARKTQQAIQWDVKIKK